MAKSLAKLAERQNLNRLCITETFIVDMFNQDEWTFWFDGTDLILDSYVEMHRETMRSQWRPNIEGKRYYRLFAQRTNVALDEVPLPFDVVQGAKAQFLKICERVKVRKESTPAD